MNQRRTHELKAPAAMEMLRPGDVKPRGWLRDWCVTAKNGYVSQPFRKQPFPNFAIFDIIQMLDMRTNRLAAARRSTP